MLKYTSSQSLPVYPLKPFFELILHVDCCMFRVLFLGLIPEVDILGGRLLRPFLQPPSHAQIMLKGSTAPWYVELVRDMGTV
jgi:hypothetical protein